MADHAHSATHVPIELLRKYDRPGPRYTSYPTAPEWSEAVGREAYVKALEAAGAQTDTPLSVYCHIPFCRKRCFYCGCNTCILNEREAVGAYLAALGRETERVGAHLGGRRTVNQLHFGGGTPTYLTVDELGNVLGSLGSVFRYADDCEKSIEIDPRVTTPEQLSFLAGQGFNRVSLGVQDFNEAVQTAVGRIQPYRLVAETVAHCRALEFKGLNFDLIYGLPKQTVASFAETIRLALSLRPDRVAVYSFAYLPQRMANQRAIKPDDLPDTEVKYGLFATAVEMFTGAGYRQIGMDHFALPEDELARAQADGRLHRNFMGYTVKTSPDMIGLGMSSIGYLNDSFFQNHSTLAAYHAAMDGEAFAVYRGLVLSRDDLIRQYVIAGLMCNFRLGYRALRDRFGADYAEYFGAEHSRLREFFDDGLVEEGEGELRVTPLGRTFVRNIAMTFDAYLGAQPSGERPQFSRTI